ncbi:transposase [Micromonospora carbonacea]|uniref:transposase n=1 Tax=Micromonospora carbonacea TaxID=47853 RepID=UPI00094535F1|nr:transposase [Micromonospora carbonacea]
MVVSTWRAASREFRDDVVRVARDREPGVTVEQIARNFGGHPKLLFKWLSQADIDADVTPGTASTESAEPREARKLREAVVRHRRRSSPGWLTCG